MDDERLKNPDSPFDYFDELLRRIQDIRTSEKRFYQKITDIYATSADYEPAQEISLQFFKTVQSKRHWANFQRFVKYSGYSSILTPLFYGLLFTICNSF